MVITVVFAVYKFCCNCVEDALSSASNSKNWYGISWGGGFIFLVMVTTLVANCCLLLQYTWPWVTSIATTHSNTII